MTASIDQVVLYNLGGLNFACFYVVVDGVKNPVFYDLPPLDKPTAEFMNELVVKCLGEVKAIEAPVVAPKVEEPPAPKTRTRKTKAEVAAEVAPVVDEVKDEVAAEVPAMAEVPAVAQPTPVEAPQELLPYKRGNDAMRAAMAAALKEFVPHFLVIPSKFPLLKQWQQRAEEKGIPCLKPQYIDVAGTPENIMETLSPTWFEDMAAFIKAQSEYAEA